MKSCEHEHVSLEQIKTRRGKSREVSSRFLSPSSSPQRRNSTSNNGLNVHDRMMSDGTRVCFGIPNQSPEVDTKENCRPWIDDVILPGRFSVDECALQRASSSRRNSSDSNVSFASTRSHKPGIEVSSKYLNNNARERPSEKCKSFRGTDSIMKRSNSAARYGSSMSQWAMSPGRSIEAHQAVALPSSNLKPPRGKGVGKLFNLGLDFFRSKKKSSPISSSPLKPKTYDAEAAHQLKLMNNRLVQWRFVNARASAANYNVASREKKQVLCALDTLTKLQNLVEQERIKLQKKNLEMKLAHVLLSQVEHLEAWEDMGRQHFLSLSMTIQALHSLLSKVPLKDGAKVNLESAVTIFRKGQAVSDAIISTVNSIAPTIEGIVPLASQLAQVAAQEKLMLEQCHDLLSMISELEMQERSLKCCLLIQHVKTLDAKLVQD